MAITAKIATDTEIKYALTTQGVINLTDDDGTPSAIDENHFQNAIYRAEGTIFAYLAKRYYAKIKSITTTNAPRFLKSLVTDLTGYFLLQRGGFKNSDLYSNSIQALERIKNGEITVWSEYDGDSWTEETFMSVEKMYMEPSSDFVDWGDPGSIPSDTDQHDGDVIETA